MFFLLVAIRKVKLICFPCWQKKISCNFLLFQAEHRFWLQLGDFLQRGADGQEGQLQVLPHGLPLSLTVLQDITEVAVRPHSTSIFFARNHIKLKFSNHLSSVLRTSLHASKSEKDIATTPTSELIKPDSDSDSAGGGSVSSSVRSSISSRYR